MLRAVRVQARQQMPNYRKPASFLIKETYPLPPYSTVIGMVHTLCGWTEYRSMRVSIQGRSAGTISDYAKNYVFGIAYDETRHQAKVDAGNGRFDGINIGPKNYELLTDVELVLHVVPEDEALLEEIRAALDFPPVYPSLGRWEDLLQIERVTLVELEPCSDGRIAKYDIYIPIESADSSDDFFSGGNNLVGTVYRLGKVFEYSGTRGRRMRGWKEQITARHVCRGSLVCLADSMLFDACHEDMVFPA